MPTRGVSYTSNHLFAIARQLAREAVKEDQKALASIPLAAAAVEARLNDVAGYASLMARPRDSTWYFSELYRIAEDARRPVLSRAQLLFRVFEGKEPDTGAVLWQDVELLFDVRDALMHRKPENYIEAEEGGLRRADKRLEKTVKSLKERARLSAEQRGDEPFTWLVMRPGVAAWGYQAAERFGTAMLEVLPRDVIWIPFRNILEELSQPSSE
jgi:hypothetical protein